MKMAKASEADLTMACDLAGALEALEYHFGATFPEGMFPTDAEGNPVLPPELRGEMRFDSDNATHCKLALNYLLELTGGRARLFRVVMGAVVMLDPSNALVDPSLDYIDHHPRRVELENAKKLRPASEWTPDMGNVQWWILPAVKPAYCGTPQDAEWHATYTHFTLLVLPDPLPEPKAELMPGTDEEVTHG